MKPREFDDLVKQKFEQGAFEYNPQNWERLADELDGRTKKRGLIFWWMPLVGIAASVTLAFGVSTALREGGKIHRIENSSIADTRQAIAKQPSVQTNTTHYATSSSAVLQKRTINQKPTPNTIVASSNARLGTSVASNNNTSTTQEEDSVSNISGTFLAKVETDAEKLKKKKKLLIEKPGLHTFLERETAQKTPKVAISLLGGINYGNQSSGYMVGATARRMVNDRLFIEGDIAFVGTSNTQQTKYLDMSKSATSGNGNTTLSSGNFAARGVNSKTSGGDAAKNTAKDDPGVIRTANQNFNLYYAQVTPSIGYKVMKRMTVGVGPDFQQMLSDNRPEASTVDRGNIKEVPMFDIGFMGKSEFAVTNSVKAAVYYREGINNIITPTNKFIDRNYIQVQVKCTIFNK